MAHPPFDPSQAVKFDLTRGAVTLSGGGAGVLVSPDALVAFCKSAGAEAVRDFGRAIGADLGRRATARLKPADQATVAAVVEHLGGDLALQGFGSLTVEQWGRAMVFRVDNSPFDEASGRVLGAVLEGALQRALSRDVRMVALMRDADCVRLLALSAQSAEKVGVWLSSGSSWGDVLTRLNGGGQA